VKLALAFLLVLSIAATLAAQNLENPWKEDSPDRSFTAAARRIPDKKYIWRDDLDGFRLVIFTLEPGPDKNTGELYFSRDFPARVPAQIQWSPDSRFLVLTTASSGGHSPWHYTTYVLSMRAGKSSLQTKRLVRLCPQSLRLSHRIQSFWESAGAARKASISSTCKDRR
jgi:hypothetical protein